MGRATRSIGADPWASAALSMNRTEENSFFGIPLLVAAAAVVVVLWRRTLVQALGAVVVFSCWLSLGEEVVVNGRATGIPGPWALLEELPVLGNVLPTRFTLVAVPALGALLALGIEEVRRVTTGMPGTPAPGCGGGAAALLVLLPVVRPPSSSTCGHHAGVLQRRLVARLGRRGRLGARAPAPGSLTPGRWSGRRRLAGASPSSRGTSSARTPRRRAAASTAPRRPR